MLEYICQWSLYILSHLSADMTSFLLPQNHWISLKMVSPWNFSVLQDDFTSNWYISAAYHAAGVPDEKNVEGLSLLLTITQVGANCVSDLYVLNIIVNPNLPKLIHSTSKESRWVTKASTFPSLYAMYFVNLNCARVGAPFLEDSTIPILLWSGYYLRKMRLTHLFTFKDPNFFKI